MIDVEFIKGKLRKIDSYAHEINVVFQFSLKEIKNDFMKYRTLERETQLIADEMVDINNHLIRRLGFSVPDSFQSTFVVLAKNDILSFDFAEKLAPIVGLRNRLVHRYEEIDIDLFLNALQKEKEDVKEYIKTILDYINKK